MNIKQKILLLLCKTIYKPKAIKKFENISKIEICKNDLEMIKNTTFNVFKININGSIKYFRECRVHEKFCDYLQNLINDYFYFLSLPEDMINNKEKILNVLLSKKTIKKIYNMGIINDNKSLVSAFFKTQNLELLQLQELSFLKIKDILDLVQYLWGEIYAYRLNSGTKYGYFQTFNSSKVLAYNKLIEILGQADLSPNVEVANLIIENKISKYGTLMDESEGILPYNLSKEQKSNVSPHFQRMCNSLNIIDALAHERDHRPGNYSVQINRNYVDSLKVFDNDSPMSFFITSNINLKTYLNSSPLITNKILNLKYIDKLLVNNILKLEKKEISTYFKPILSNIQVYFLWLRISKMKSLLYNTIREKEKMFLSQDEWSFSTIKDELNDTNINTYLKIFCYSDKKESNYKE